MEFFKDGCCMRKISMVGDYVHNDSQYATGAYVG